MKWSVPCRAVPGAQNVGSIPFRRRTFFQAWASLSEEEFFCIENVSKYTFLLCSRRKDMHNPSKILFGSQLREIVFAKSWLEILSGIS